MRKIRLDDGTEVENHLSSHTPEASGSEEDGHLRSQSPFSQSPLIGRLKKHVEEISGLRHGVDDYLDLEKRADYIEQQFLSFRLPVQSQHLEFKKKIYRNVITIVEGDDPALSPLLIGAHYDGQRTTIGADDNASGVAVLLEVARALAEVELRRSIHLVAFTLEEPQTFTHIIRRGSRHFASRARRDGVAYEGAVILECVGYTASRQKGAYLSKIFGMQMPKEGNFLGVIANQPSKPLMDRFIATANQAAPFLPVVGYAAPAQGYLLPQVRFSDHSSFWERGYPAIMLNDTVMFRNPHYHKMSDRPETVDYGFMEQVTAAVTAFAQR